VNRAERHAWRRRYLLRDPRLTEHDRMLLHAAEKLGGGRLVLDADTISLLQHPEIVLEASP